MRPGSCLRPTRLLPASRCSWSDRYNSDGLHFNTWNVGNSESLFRAAGGHPDVLGPRDLTTRTDGSTVTQLHVSRMFRTIGPSLHRLCCSNQNFQSRARRSGAAVSFRLPSGEYWTTTRQIRIHPTCWKRKKGFMCTRDSRKTEGNSEHLCLSLLHSFLALFFSTFLSVLFVGLTATHVLEELPPWPHSRHFLS